MRSKHQITKLLNEIKATCASDGREPTSEERSEIRMLVDELDSLSAEEARQLLYQPQRLTTENGNITKAEKKNGNRFSNIGEQLRSIVAAERPGGVYDSRLADLQLRAASGLQESVSSDGGFLVQNDFSNEIFSAVFDNSEILKRITKYEISTNSNNLKIPAIDEGSRQSGSRGGGCRAYWSPEADALTASKIKFRQMELSLKKLTILIYCTDEILADSSVLSGFIQQKATEEINFMLQDAILNGNGAGQPLGILNSPCLVSVSKETGQKGTTLMAENVINMHARLHVSDPSRVVWLINKDVEPQLHTMSIGVGTGGVPVYMPAGGLSQAPYGTLFGKPVLPIEQCPTLGSVGDILLVDLSQYVAIQKGNIKSDMSIHVRFQFDESVFRFVVRFDGQPGWSSAVTPYKGTSNTISPFVALAAR